MHERRGPSTRSVHAGLPAAVQGEPFLPGPVLASAFHLAGDDVHETYGYQREGNPTWDNYERALGELEGGEAVLFASGMAAVAAVVMQMGQGDVFVGPHDAYPGVRDIARRATRAARDGGSAGGVRHATSTWRRRRARRWSGSRRPRIRGWA